MGDRRLETLASVISRYSLEVQPGDLVVVESPAQAQPFLVPLTRELTRLGATPVLRPHLDSVNTLILERGSDEQLDYLSPVTEFEAMRADRYLTVWAESNTRRSSGVPEGNQARRRRARKDLFMRFFDRLAKGEARWCGVTLPTDAQAQEAGMALADYEDFVFGAGHLDDDDPIAAWHEVSRRQQAVIDRLAPIRELRIVAPDTDLTVDVAGRAWQNADGRENFPDGEIYTSPDETMTQGHIHFTIDAGYNGHEVAGVRLWFEDGKVVREEATRGADVLREALDTDPGARYLGEVAFGLNDEIQRATKNTAFDEKIGGTCHVALGMAFPEAGGTNQSAVHWDLVCDLRDGGEVYGDGELIAKNGRFL